MIASLSRLTHAARRSGGPPALVWHIRDMRWLWGLMLVVHAPGLVRTWAALLGGTASIGQIEGCAWLTISAVFFALKLRRVPWLEFRADRRSAVALTVAVLLMHSEPLGLRAADTRASELPAATLVLVMALDSVQRRLLRLVATVGACRGDIGALPARLALAAVPLRSRAQSAVLCRHAPRPPPAVSLH